MPSSNKLYCTNFQNLFNMVSISIISMISCLLPMTFAGSIHHHLGQALLNYTNDQSAVNQLAGKVLTDDRMTDQGPADNLWTYNTEHGHDILDEAVLYEFWLSDVPFSKRSLNRFLRQYYAGFNFQGLTDKQYDFVMNRWIYQMLPSSF